MSFTGTLLSIFDKSGKVATAFPLKWIAFDNYQVTLNSQDIDSYRDADGNLHRNALPHKVGKIEFNTPYLKQSEVVALTQFFTSRFIDANEKKLFVQYYCPEKDEMRTEYMYMADMNFKIYSNSTKGYIYEPTRIALIGY